MVKIKVSYHYDISSNWCMAMFEVIEADKFLNTKNFLPYTPHYNASETRVSEAAVYGKTWKEVKKKEKEVIKNTKEYIEEKRKVFKDFLIKTKPNTKIYVI